MAASDRSILDHGASGSCTSAAGLHLPSSGKADYPTGPGASQIAVYGSRGSLPVVWAVRVSTRPLDPRGIGSQGRLQLFLGRQSRNAMLGQGLVGMPVYREQYDRMVRWHNRFAAIAQ